MVEYEFYIGAYRGGSISPEEWPAAEREASAMLARYKRIYTVTAPADSTDAEDMAVCAMAEALVYHAKAESGVQGAIASASIGSVSTSYSTATGVDHSRPRQQKDVYRAACLYLDICRGVG